MLSELPLYTSYCVDALRELANEDNAQQMEAYMKGHFRYFGVKAPERRKVFSQANKAYKKMSKQELWPNAHALYAQEERECHYLAIDLLIRYGKLLSMEDMPLIEDMILQHSWWDSVDALASNVVGLVLLRDKPELRPCVERWRASDELWLQRTALICQLKWRVEVDDDLLFETIDALTPSKEFFINKGAGWALRQLSKFRPDAVRDYLASREHHGLIVREGSKYL